jgi:hypothetical protein
LKFLKIVTEKKEGGITTYGQQDGMLKQNSCFVWPEMKTFEQEEIMERRFKALVQEGYDLIGILDAERKLYLC